VTGDSNSGIAAEVEMNNNAPASDENARGRYAENSHRLLIDF